MTIALIAAAAGKDLVIGKDNDLPWHFASDLKFFKETTRGHDVLMGRKTYQSILKRLGKPLPDRRNIVLTRDKTFKDERATVIYDVSEITELADKNKTLFVIGGSTLFEQSIGIADKIYMTHIDQEIGGDTYFPKLNPQIWKLTQEDNMLEKDVTLRFCIYERRAALK